MNMEYCALGAENAVKQNISSKDTSISERQKKLLLNDAASSIKKLPSIPLMALTEERNKRECNLERVLEKREGTKTSGAVLEQNSFTSDQELEKETEVVHSDTKHKNSEELHKTFSITIPETSPPQYKYIPCPCGGWHQNNAECFCPMCELGRYIMYIFRNQRQASRHVMVTRPSPYFVQTNGLPPAVAELSIPRKMEICPMFEAFGFCPYSVGCYLPHPVQHGKNEFEYHNDNTCFNITKTMIETDYSNTNDDNDTNKYNVNMSTCENDNKSAKLRNCSTDCIHAASSVGMKNTITTTIIDDNDSNNNNNSNNKENWNMFSSSVISNEEAHNIYKEHISPIIPLSSSAEDEFERLCRKAEQHLDSELWTCEVCGYGRIDEFCLGPVGERVYYRQCPRCLCMCYYPQITYLIYHIIKNAADDYAFCKKEIDRFRAALPDEFKIPFTFEAHRVANIIFSWSLLRPCDARDAVDVAHRYLPEMTSIVSMGSGSGYVEHVFNRVMNSTVKDLYDFHRVHPHETSSFDGIQASFYGAKTIDIFAFDELALRRSYSVHVSHGGPLSLLSIDCPRSVLLLSWPPFGSAHEEQSSMGFEALEYYTQGGGTMLIYIGDVGSTGDWRFHELLYTHYKLVREYPVRREIPRWCPQDMGLVYAGSDTIEVYRRRPNPVQIPPS